MKDASHDLYAFTFHALRGICNHAEKIHIEVIETPPRTTSLILDCAAEDRKFVYARLRELKIIAISIAQRHHSIVNILIDDSDEII
jgi:hypothetical protein